MEAVWDLLNRELRGAAVGASVGAKGAQEEEGRKEGGGPVFLRRQQGAALSVQFSPSCPSDWDRACRMRQ